MEKLKVMTIFGTRPEAIKMCPLILEMRKHPDTIEPIVAVTAQHREMLDQVMTLFDIKPDYDLNIMTAGQTLYDVTTRALMGLRDVLEKAQPDLVLVHGDTTTTFVGALAAFYRQIRVGHVEAGLRTGNKYSPYPEEMNRKLTGALADFHFAPTGNAKRNLLKENVAEESIYVTGNTVIDALKKTVKNAFDFHNQKLEAAIRSNHKLILMTTHRRENLGAPMRHVYQALKEVLRDYPEAEAIFPMHKNPKVGKWRNRSLVRWTASTSLNPWIMNRLPTSWPALISFSRIRAESRKKLRLLANRSSSCAIRRSVLKRLRQGR